MKNIKLYNLIKDYEIHDNGLIFINYCQAEDFFKQLKEFVDFDEGNGPDGYLGDTYLCFNIEGVCDDNGLDWKYVKENSLK